MHLSKIKKKNNAVSTGLIQVFFCRFGTKLLN